MTDRLARLHLHLFDKHEQVRGFRADKIWTHDDEANFLQRAPAHLYLPLLLALWTGQRQRISFACRARHTTVRRYACVNARAAFESSSQSARR
jgi:hypothetical protein